MYTKDTETKPSTKRTSTLDYINDMPESYAGLVSASKLKTDAALLTALLQMGQTHAEKCELKEARAILTSALALAKKLKNFPAMMEAMSGLLRLAADSMCDVAIKKWSTQLDNHIKAYPDHTPPMAWYCKGTIAFHKKEWFTAQKYFLTCIRQAKRTSGASSIQVSFTLSQKDMIARAWTTIANILFWRNRPKRAEYLLKILLNRYEKKNLRSVNGILYMIYGKFEEKNGEPQKALSWYQKANASYLEEHNWYLYLYVLCAYARVSRLQQNYPQASWYLDLLDKATKGPEMEFLRERSRYERNLLNAQAVDLSIDTQNGVIQTREKGKIQLRKQYILLGILEVLAQAYQDFSKDADRGLSKSDLIERVWNQKYRPEAHDNKLYYNINRLRRLIEPNVHEPRYLLNWKEGYRLCPGLKLQLITAENSAELLGNQQDNNEDFSDPESPNKENKV